MSYEIQWVTAFLGVGRAPMSYDEFEEIKAQGVKCIVNLCHEYSDLHTLEEAAGFEVYYLPTYDDYAPSLEDLDKGLQWLDEALYLKKKVLVHCRFGIGRTGTFTSAYMIRRGLDLKKTKKELKATRAQPSTYRQWKAVKKYKKLQSELSRKTPQVEHNRYKDLTRFYEEYLHIVAEVDRELEKRGLDESQEKQYYHCCTSTFELPFIEALYLNNCINCELNISDRNATIDRALLCRKNIEKSIPPLATQSLVDISERGASPVTQCPLHVNGKCMLFAYRPIKCRVSPTFLQEPFMQEIEKRLERLSGETFLALVGQFPKQTGVYLPMIDVVSGKFIQTSFHLMAAVQK